MRLFGVLSPRNSIKNQKAPKRVVERSEFAELQEFNMKTKIIESFDDWENLVDYDKLQKALTDEDVELLKKSVKWDEMGIPEVDDINLETLVKAGTIELESITVAGEYVFKSETDRIKTFIEKTFEDRLENITDQGRKSLENQYKIFISEGADVNKTATDIRKNIGLNSRQSKALENYRISLEAEDIPKKRVEKLISSRRETMLDYRARMIARTETTNAMSFGVVESGKQLIDDGTFKKKEVFKEWVSILDTKTSLSCQERNEMVVGIDEEFPDPSGQFGEVLHPPGHVNCRSDIIITFKTK